MIIFSVSDNEKIYNDRVIEVKVYFARSKVAKLQRDFECLQWLRKVSGVVV